MSKPITQTKELLIAVLTGFAATAEAKRDDGLVSRTEALAIVFKHAGPAWIAITGITDVPEEIADLDEAELEELTQAALDSQAWPDTPENRAIVTSVKDSIWAGLKSIRLLAGKAEGRAAEQATDGTDGTDNTDDPDQPSIPFP